MHDARAWAMLDRRDKRRRRRRLDDRRLNRTFFLDQIDVQDAVRRRMSDARGFAPHLDIEESKLDRRQQKRERDSERDGATVRRRTHPTQTSLPGSRVAGECQRAYTMPVGLNDVQAINLC